MSTTAVHKKAHTKARHVLSDHHHRSEHSMKSCQSVNDDGKNSIVTITHFHVSRYALCCYEIHEIQTRGQRLVDA